MKKWRFKSYLSTIFGTIFASIIIISVLVVLVAIWDANATVKKEIENQNMNTVTQMQCTFDIIFQQLYTITNYNYLDVDVQSFMNGDAPYGIYDYWGERFKELTDGYRYIQSYVYEIGFYDAKNQKVWISSLGDSTTSIPIEKYADSSVCNKIDEMKEFENGIYPHLYRNSHPYVLTLIKKDKKENGASFLSIHMEKLGGFVPQKSVDYYVIDENGVVLYSENREKMGVFYRTIEDFNDWEISSGTKWIAKDSLTISCIKSTRYDWYYVGVRNNTQIGISKSRIYVIYLLASCICIIGLVISLLSSRRAVQPLETIMNMLNDHEITTSQYSYVELQNIAQKMAGILSSNKKLMVRLEKMLKEFDELQSAALQYQINPHFLYNTLNMASVYAAKELGPRHDTVTIIRKLSEILQYSLNYEDHIVGLDEELVYLRIYLSILEKRYREKFKIVWEIPDDILNSRIVRMSIQPLVENAVHHGVQPQGGGTIKIGGIRMNDSLMVWVSDDGVGMSREEIEELKRRIEEDKMQSKHIGLANVHRRLQIIFGKEYGVSVTSEFPKGVRTTITIPYMEEPNIEN